MFPGAYSQPMSVKVDLDTLAEALADFSFAYLVTVGDDYRAHTVAVALAVGRLADTPPVEWRAGAPTRAPRSTPL